jgi:hypothetical protein
MSELFNFSSIEKESVVLAATFELINSAVNYSVLEIGKGEHVQIGFETSVHFNFFTILLVDFLSKPDVKVFGIEESYLSSSKAITANPLLGKSRNSTMLADAVNSFSSWLESKMLYEKAWFPSVNLQTDLSIKRFELIDLCGNISKHNFTRLTRVAKSFRRVFRENGHDLNLHQSLSIIGEFQEQFHPILSYHATTISFFLNEIRWGIYEYLRPVYLESVVLLDGDPPAYRYNFPHGLEHEFAKECFWDLMNKVRSEPYVPRFAVPWYFKKHY